MRMRIPSSFRKYFFPPLEALSLWRISLSRLLCLNSLFRWCLFPLFRLLFPFLSLFLLCDFGPLVFPFFPPRGPDLLPSFLFFLRVLFFVPLILFRCLRPPTRKKSVKFKSDKTSYGHNKIIVSSSTQSMPWYVRSGSQYHRHFVGFFNVPVPPWGPGGLSRECAPPYPQRDRKRRLNGAVCRNHRIKRLVPCRC